MRHMDQPFSISFIANMPKFMKNTDRVFDPAEIVGGQKSPDPIQWQVSCQTNGFHFCGGIILNEDTVLSAAHCFPPGTKVKGMKIRDSVLNSF